MLDLLSRFESGRLTCRSRSGPTRCRRGSRLLEGALQRHLLPNPEILTISILDDIAPAIFYAALAATAGGAIVLARGAVEGSSAGSRRAGFALVGLGLAAILAAVVIYATGPRRVLPF